ncbi:MAG: hypothetical protein ACR2OE_04090 [Thermomicrobiales bacterium]
MSEPRPRWGSDPLTSIRQERAYQFAKYPGGAAHDNAHTYAELALILGQEYGEAVDELKRLQWPEDFPTYSAMNVLGRARSELIQVAAVAVAIIERIDREAAK